MATYTVTFLSRDRNGQFKKRHKRISAVSHQDVLAYITHGHRHGKWDLEGDITVRGPVGHSDYETVTFEK